MLQSDVFLKSVPAVLCYKCTGLLLHIGRDFLHFLTVFLLFSHFNRKMTASEYEPSLSTVYLKYQILQLNPLPYPTPPAPKAPSWPVFLRSLTKLTMSSFLLLVSDHIDTTCKISNIFNDQENMIKGRRVLCNCQRSKLPHVFLHPT